MNTAVKEVQVIKATITGEKTEKIRVAAYCRVSTDKNDQLNSFFAQMRYYRDYVRGNDKMVLVDIYADEGITGTELTKRDEMKRLIRDCKHKKIDRVLVKSVTRFARNSLECIETIRTMKSCGVSVLFENDHIDTETMNSEMMLYIKSAFAQCEATSASKRMSTSIRMKMEDGTYYNTSRPYGYKWKDRNLVIVPEEAEIVREIFSMYLSGESFNSIIATIQPRTPERKWSPYSIGYVLTNEKYVGDILWQKSFTPSVLPLRKRYNRGEMPRYLCNDAHQAIISREDFSIVKRLMSERKEKFYSQNKREHGLYYGKIKCRSCGWTYRQHKTKKCTEWVCGKTRKGTNTFVEVVNDKFVVTLSDYYSRTGSNMLFEYNDSDGNTYVIFFLWNFIGYKVKVCEYDENPCITHCPIAYFYHADGTQDSTVFGVLGNPHVSAISPCAGFNKLFQEIKIRLLKLDERDLSQEYLQKCITEISNKLQDYQTKKISIAELLDFEHEDTIIPVYILEQIYTHREEYRISETFYQNMRRILQTNDRVILTKETVKKILNRYLKMDSDGTFITMLKDAFLYFHSTCCVESKVIQ